MTHAEWMAIYCRAPVGTVAEVGGFRGDGLRWGWRGELGWLYFRTEDAACRFADVYRRLAGGLTHASVT